MSDRASRGARALHPFLSDSQAMTANAVLPGVVTTTGLGIVELKIDITDSLSGQMAEVLELRMEPCVVSFDFAQMWVLKEDEKVPFPTVKYVTD